MRLKKPMFRSRDSLSARAQLDLYACSAQPVQSAACHQRVGVGQAGHHFGHTRFNQRITAWPGAALMGAWLERHISGRRRAPNVRGQRHRAAP